MKLYFEYSVLQLPFACGPLKSLLVDKVDSETIWEQIQTRNRPLKRFFENEGAYLAKALDKLPIQNRNNKQNSSNSNLKSTLNGSTPMDDQTDDSSDEENDIDMPSDEDEEDGSGDDSNDGDSVDKESFQSEASVENSDQEAIDSEEEENMVEKWLEEAEDIEEIHQKHIEKLLQKDGHKGSVEDVSV